MDASLSLGYRNPLHAVNTRFIFERTIDLLAAHSENDLLEST